MEIKNAIIKSTMLGIEDHGIMTCFLHLNYGDGSGQSFGGYSLDRFDKSFFVVKNNRISTVWGIEFIRRILDTIGVDSWGKLPNKHCRVLADYGKVYKIGNIIEDKWFDPEEDLANLKRRLL